MRVSELSTKRRSRHMQSPADPDIDAPPSRQYIELTPTDTPLDPTTVESQFRHLHTLHERTQRVLVRPAL